VPLQRTEVFETVDPGRLTRGGASLAPGCYILPLQGSGIGSLALEGEQTPSAVRTSGVTVELLNPLVVEVASVGSMPWLSASV
jgi:hypothetical protein